MGRVNFVPEAEAFLQALFRDLESRGIHLEEDWDIDHICFRSESLEDYDHLKTEFGQLGELLIESEVNGRPISTFKLSHPLKFKHWEIDLLELPAPKKGKTTERGFEHIEVVCPLPFRKLKEMYSQVKMDEKGLEKDFNRELELTLGQRNLKFHQTSLESVIRLEKNAKVWTALRSSAILKHFFSCDPLVVGTFPLNLHAASSDLDILLRAQDLKELERSLRDHYGECPQFEIRPGAFAGLPTLTCRFVFEGTPFKIFAQDRDTVDQTAYRYFHLEEALLKRLGESLREKVIKLREAGLKTEMAFAKALGLEGDLLP